MKTKFFSLFNLYKDSFLLFYHRRGPTMAAAATFYALITLIPLFMVLLKTMGFLMGDWIDSGAQMIELLKGFFPPHLMRDLEGVFDALLVHLKANRKVTLVNLIFLVVSSLSFFNSIWSGLFIITNERSHLSLWNHLKGLVIIASTVVIICIATLVPLFMGTLSDLLKKSTVVSLLESLKMILSDTFINSLMSFQFDTNELLGTSMIFFILFLLYFSFLYRWFFNWRITLRESLIGSLTFVVTLVLGKNIFWIYLNLASNSFMRNYGSYYVLFFGLFWIFIVMNFFFYGAAVCNEMKKLR